MSVIDRVISDVKAVEIKDPLQYTFIIGIDFGTTYSGVSYARTDVELTNGRIHYSEITDIKNWPHGNFNLIQAKTQAIYVNNQLETFGGKKLPIKKQKAAKLNNHSINEVSLFKLYLDESRSMNVPPLPEGLFVVDVIADYLRKLYDHTISEMDRTLGSDLVQRDCMKFSLTVPAVWTDRAKSVMRDAVIKAGLIKEEDPSDRLVLVSEPEAAALFCANFLTQYNLKHGDRFLICDAGGGTVDLVTYELNNDENGKYLIEVVEGDGGICGSVCLDQYFRKLFDEMIETLDIPPLEEKEIDEVVDSFIDIVKLQVLHPDDPEFDDDYQAIKLQSHKFDDIDMEEDGMFIADGQLYIKPAVLIDEVFDPVVDEVLELIESQMNRASRNVSALFLVGGFGQSKYLITRIRQVYSKEIHLIAAPDRGDLAIARGAVLMGLAPTYVKKRVIRRSYGYKCSLPFEEDIDLIQHVVYNKDNEKFCNKRFVTYAKKGQIEDIDYFAEVTFRSYYRGSPSLYLYAYDGDVNEIPRYTTDRNVKNIAKFVIKLPELEKSSSDVIVIKVKFFLYQTEIKIEVEIEGHTNIYTGLYPKNDLYGNRTLSVSFSSSTRSTNIDLEDLGIQGYSNS